MISRDDYKTHLLSKGSHLGEVRKNQADMIMNTTFTEDIAYRRVYILDPVSGWHYEDAKLFKHQTPQLARDAVDSWLRFRPKVHYPVGCYVFIPDDTSYKLDIDEERPFKGNIGNLHMIVDRTYYKQFPQYMVLKINWDLKWVMGSGDRKRIDHCLGCVRNANSYTSGIWTDFRTTSVDTITKCWVPDTYNVYKDRLKDFDLCDTRHIEHGMRVMITHNVINPKVYQISKVDDTTPAGVVQLTLKQDLLNLKRDNPELMVCDYYDNSGDVIIVKPDTPEEPVYSVITYMEVNSDGELEEATAPSALSIGMNYYYSANFADAQWRIEAQGDYSDEERIALEKLMVIRKVDGSTISVKPGKSNKIKGQQFKLIVCDINGDHESSIDLEVAQ